MTTQNEVAVNGGGGWYEPSAERTALVGEVWRGEIAAYTWWISRA